MTATFGIVAFAWKRPRFDPDKAGRPLPRWATGAVDSRAVRSVIGGVALLFTAWVAMAAIWGPQGSGNALQGVFYVLLWVGLVATSLLIGPVWRVLSPIRVLVLGVQRLSGREARRRYPDRLGYWPAAIGLGSFVWLELASPDPGSLTAIKVWLLVYAVVMTMGAALYGDPWLRRADPFDVYSVAVSRMSVFGRDRRTGEVTVGNPLNRLPSMPVRSGLVAVLAVLLGSTAFDSFSATPGFRAFADSVGAQTTFGETLVRTAGLALFIGVVAATFWAAARATGGVDRDQRRQLPGLLAHSLIPIVVGYVFAHYLSYLIERGQETVVRLADPLGRGWHLLGLDPSDIHYVLSMHPGVLSTIKVSCVVIGHIIAVIAAHDRALRVLPSGHQITGQLAMMLTMVFYTFGGLYLLFGG